MAVAAPTVSSYVFFMAKLQLILSEDSQPVHELTDDKTTIGRSDDNTLPIDDGSVSGNHAEIVSEADGYHLRDLGSTNGTFVNGEQTKEALLRDNDEIRFGGIAALFLSGVEAAGDAQPLPEPPARSTQAANESTRPKSFSCSSPIPKNVRKKDPVALAALVLGGLALAVAGVAVALTFSVPG